MAKKKSEEGASKKINEILLDESLLTALKILNDKYGEGTAIIGAYAPKNLEVISTSSLALDDAIGVGGIPKGSIVEIYGPEMSGKTTLAIHMLAEAQKQGNVVAIIDMEHGMEMEYAEALGLDSNFVIFSQPGTGEEALTIADTLIKTGKIGMLVIDSVAALVPEAELESKVEDQHVGRQARMMSAFLRRIQPIVGNTKTILIFINQLREKIGTYGNPETTPGGRALKFYSKIRIDLRAIDKIMENGVQVGSVVRAKIVKNKYNPPYKVAEFDLIYGKGIDKISEIISLAITRGILRRGGSWYFMGEEKIAQGREALREYLENNPEMVKKILEGLGYD